MNVLVTGGGGFVGKAIVKQALARQWRVSVVGRNDYPDIEAMGCECFKGDIRNGDQLQHFFKGQDIVFHVAALAGIWGSWHDYSTINVEGTRNVIAACLAQGVRGLVYTSTPSVVFSRADICQGDEGLDYPQKFLCHYARSKAAAEKMVLSQSGPDLLTCAIRPHLIWGPGDPHLIPRLLKKGKRRELKQVGDGANLVDISYVDNVAHAHILAAVDLATARKAAGKPYFVSQGEPVNLWDWINSLYTRVGIEPVTRNVSFPVAYAAGSMLELFYTLLRIKSEPKMTRFLAEQLAKSHYFSTKSIEADLGYAPLISTEEGLSRLVEWIKKNEKALL